MEAINKLVRPNILKLKGYKAKDRIYNTGSCFMDTNELPFGKWNRYPDPLQMQLKKAIAEWKNLNTDQIFLANGSDQIIDLLIRVFCIPSQDKIMMFSPGFSMYKISAEINDVECIESKLDEQFQIDIEETGTLINVYKPKIVFLCSPNSPTGNLIKPETINYLLDTFEGILVIDEAYIDFSESPSYISKLNHYPRLVVMQTFSKSLGAAGLRIGLGLSNPLIINLLNKVKAPFNMNSAGILEGLELLKNKSQIRSNIDIIKKERILLYTELSKLQTIDKIYPSDANFYFITVNNAKDVCDVLNTRNIYVKNFNSKIPNALRITIGSPKENKNLIEVLKKIDNEESTVY